MTTGIPLDSGRFWLPENPNHRVGGWLDLTSHWPRVTLADPLTPAMREAGRAAGEDGQQSIVSVPADDDIDPDGLTLHGHLRGTHDRITLVNALTVGRSRLIGPGWTDEGDQQVQADYALLGDHINGACALFDQVRLRVAYLDEWALLPGLTTEILADGSQIRIEHLDPGDIGVEVQGLGRLLLRTVVSAPDPSVRGVSLGRQAELVLDLTDSLTFEDIWQRFVSPVATLISLCADQTSGVANVHLRSEVEQRWLQVLHPDVATRPGTGTSRPDGTRLVFTREVINLGHVARWLTSAPTLFPIPGIVASSRGGSDRTLPNQLLDLATAAEGLSRRLPAEPNTISPGQARSARRAAREAVDARVRERVNDALLHLGDPSYAERLHTVTEMVSESIPEVFGDRMLWERKIKSVRNGFAHHLQQPPTEEWREYIVLWRTLRWALVAALLQVAGVDPSALGRRLREHEPYRYQLRQARRWMPDLYAQPQPDR